MENDHCVCSFERPYQPLLEFDDELILAKSKKTSYKALPQWALFGIQDIPADVSMSQYAPRQTTLQ